MEKEFLAELITDVVSGLSTLQCAIANHNAERTVLSNINIQSLEKVLKRLNEKAELLLKN